MLRLLKALAGMQKGKCVMEKTMEVRLTSMDLRGENIPVFLDFLESLPAIPADCAPIWHYFNKNLCW